MKWLFWIALVLAAVLPGGCSERDDVVAVASDDAEMNAAIAKARETLGEFWAVFEERSRGERDFGLKVGIGEGDVVEHIWTVDIERRDGKIMGTIENEPDTVRRVKRGDRIEIPEADISDWLYWRDGKMFGCHTLRPVFKHMSAAEVEEYKAIMAEP